MRRDMPGDISREIQAFMLPRSHTQPRDVPKTPEFTAHQLRRLLMAHYCQEIATLSKKLENIRHINWDEIDQTLIALYKDPPPGEDPLANVLQWLELILEDVVTQDAWTSGGA